MKWYILNGFLPTPYVGISNVNEESIDETIGISHERLKASFPEKGYVVSDFWIRKIFSNHQWGEISVLLYGEKEASLVINADSQEKAYELALSLRSLLSVFHNRKPPDCFSCFMMELSSAPKSDMEVAAIAKLISPHAQKGGMDWFIENELKSGVFVTARELKHAIENLGEIIDDNHLKDAFLLLENSFEMVDGNMNASYYHSHYKPNKEEQSEDQLNRIHLENRFKYDSAFVSAFRGIECILRSHNFYKKDIAGLLLKADCLHSTNFSKEQYFCHFDGETEVSYDKIVGRCLDKRNAISAHGNPGLGRKSEHWVSEPQVFEIQFLLKAMLWKIILKK